MDERLEALLSCLFLLIMLPIFAFGGIELVKKSSETTKGNTTKVAVKQTKKPYSSITAPDNKPTLGTSEDTAVFYVSPTPFPLPTSTLKQESLHDNATSNPPENTLDDSKEEIIQLTPTPEPTTEEAERKKDDKKNTPKEKQNTKSSQGDLCDDEGSNDTCGKKDILSLPILGAVSGISGELLSDVH